MSFPATSTLLYTNVRMAFSDLIHGPPDMAQPGQFCMVKRKPRRLASSAVCFTAASQCSLRQAMLSVVAGHRPPN